MSVDTGLVREFLEAIKLVGRVILAIYFFGMVMYVVSVTWLFFASLFISRAERRRAR